MTKKRFTIIILPPESTDKPRQFQFPVSYYKAARNFLIILALALSYIFYDYGDKASKALELANVKKENTVQKIELQKLSKKTGDLEAQFSKLKLFDKKLRIIANLEKPNQPEDLTGIGGGLPEGEALPTLDGKRNAMTDRMHAELSQLEAVADMQEASFTELQVHLMKQSALLASTPSIWPARGWLTSSYGKRIDPFTGRPQRHKGLDVANRVGTEVIAPADGIVTKVTKTAALGKLIEVSHGYGVKTRYAHLSKSYVKVGKKIKRGEKIAAIGNTGRSTGPHLHYEVHIKGIAVNPYNYILN
ncbi:MAG: M23 family metallopeptidase [Thermodesulfobacteriota bacterium]